MNPPILNVNLWGVIHGVQVFLPLLKENSDGGHIVNTASMSGFATLPSLGAYAVSKFGVVALSEVLSKELALEGSHVGVTILAPGATHTQIHNSMRNRPTEYSCSQLADVDLKKSPQSKEMIWRDPKEVGDIVIHAIENRLLYAFTHPELAERVYTRHEAIMAGFKDSPKIPIKR